MLSLVVSLDSNTDHWLWCCVSLNVLTAIASDMLNWSRDTSWLQQQVAIVPCPSMDLHLANQPVLKEASIACGPKEQIVANQLCPACAPKETL